MSERQRRSAVAVVIAAVAAVLVAGLLAVTFNSGTGNAANHPSPTTTVPHSHGQPATCWKVQTDSGTSYRVLSNGVPPKDRSSAQATLDYELQQAHTYPQALQAIYNRWAALNNQPQVADWHTLVSGNCYNTTGQTLWFSTWADYNTATVQDATAPANGCNTSVGPNGQATCTVESITGDRSGISVTFSNGQTIWIMYRCGNPVSAAPASAPTPQATPPAPSPSPTPSVGCPPGQHPSPYNGTCIESKDPAQDPLNNAAVSPIVKGPGTTPPGASPGPPQQPVDSPTGCPGTCPGPTTPTTAPTVTPTTAAPTPTPVSTQPPSSGGSTVVTAPSSS